MSRNEEIITYVIAAIVLIGVIFSSIYQKNVLYFNVEVNNEGRENGDYLFTIKKINNCSNWKKIYYIDSFGRNYYLYCLDDVMVNFDDRSITLKEALDNKEITIEDIIGYLSDDSKWLDDGTHVYKDDGKKKYSSGGFSVLKCHNIDFKSSGSRDVYIGPMSMKYGEELCKYDITEDSTYSFYGKSEHFKFDDGKVYYSNKYKQLLISNFKMIKPVGDIDELSINLYFNDKLSFTTVYEGETKRNYSINEYLDEIIILKNSEERSNSFTETNKENFKDSIKLDIKYCIKDDCETETMSLYYANLLLNKY